MPMVFAAVVPHTPLLVPTIAKEHQRFLAATRESVTMVMHELYARQADCIILFTPHGPDVADGFVLQLADRFLGRLSNFGDLSTHINFQPAQAEAQRLKEIAEDHGLPVRLQTQPELDYGVTVPLVSLEGAEPLPRLLPITVTRQPLAQMVILGKVIQELFHASTTRYALLASADFTRRSPDATSIERRPSLLERTVAESLSTLDLSRLAELQTDDDACGLGPTMALLASLQGMAARGVIRSFEAPLNVGLLVSTLS